jgi:hypothetical protein
MRAFCWAPGLLGFHPGAERFTNLPSSVDLSLHSHSHSIGCGTFLSYYQRYDPVQLQGARNSHLLLMRPRPDVIRRLRLLS